MGGQESPVYVTLTDPNTDTNVKGEPLSNRYRCRLVVGADGNNSYVRKALGLPTWGWGYGRRAIVCNVVVENPNSNSASESNTKPSFETAFQVFTPTGPLAFLPLWNNQASIIWSTTPEHAEY